MTKRKATPLEAVEFITPAQPEPPAPAAPMAIDDQLIFDDTPAESPVITLNVRGCSACGGDHNGVLELPLLGPALDIRTTHYFICPTNGQTVYVEHIGE